MKILLKILALIFVLIVAIVIVVPFILSVDTVFDEVSQKVEQATGRVLTASGDKALSVFPNLRLELNDVNFANMKSGSHSNMISMKKLTVNIGWLSLLSGDLKLERFVITEPNILLEKNKTGDVNWHFLPKNVGNTSENRGVLIAPKDTQEQVSIPDSFDIKLGEVAIYGGKLKYIDATTNVMHEVNDFNLTIDLPSLREAMSIKGSLVYMAQKFELDTHITTPIQVIMGNDFSVKTQMKSKLVSLNFNGDIKENNKEISGALNLKGGSLKNIFKWQNVPLVAKENAFNEFSFSGEVYFANEKLSLTKLNAKLDLLDIKGESDINLENRLNITANFDLGMLNLNPYLSEATQASEQVENKTKEQKPQPIIWDETQIDLSSLTKLDSHIKVHSQGLKFKDITLGENAFSFILNQGVANISMDSFNAYKGKGKGKVIINAKKAPYKIETNFALTSIQAGPLLNDAVKFDKLSGAGSIDWQLKMQGDNQKAFIQSLNGRLGFSFNDGAIQGANIAAMVRSAQAMLKGDFSKAGLDKGYDKSQKTDFAELSGIFNFQNGVGTNKDFKLASPLIRIKGKGVVDLPKTKVDYGVTTGLVSNIEGQGTKSSSTGFKVPVLVKGQFHNVKIKLDVSSASKDKLKNSIKDKLKKLFG
ncbi:AsmA family protein [Pseudoalteromonas denitrificans]|uniref:AsmA protein n=1 Tax=Pseudoalteromonas denitrificans DSM 6059 TaxID=1123010 RepID=A0A1I1S151_9GAMM|nr:AsmA family protein [Pseudoalteromonas denitrificans]SFD40067.1 AsmA protein [Pseudoalteromonas denitrificans DSM 6059]